MFNNSTHLVESVTNELISDLVNQDFKLTDIYSYINVKNIMNNLTVNITQWLPVNAYSLQQLMIGLIQSGTYEGFLAILRARFGENCTIATDDFSIPFTINVAITQTTSPSPFVVTEQESEVPSSILVLSTQTGANYFSVANSPSKVTLVNTRVVIAEGSPFWFFRDFLTAGIRIGAFTLS